MKLDKFKIKHEDDGVYHILTPNGSTLSVSKEGLHKHAQEVISKMERMSADKYAEGGDVEKDYKKKQEGFSADSVIQRTYVEQHDMSDPKNKKRFEAMQEMLHPQEFADGGTAQSDYEKKLAAEDQGITPVYPEAILGAAALPVVAPELTAGALSAGAAALKNLGNETGSIGNLEGPSVGEFANIAARGKNIYTPTPAAEAIKLEINGLVKQGWITPQQAVQRIANIEQQYANMANAGKFGKVIQKAEGGEIEEPESGLGIAGEAADLENVQPQIPSMPRSISPEINSVQPSMPASSIPMQYNQSPDITIKDPAADFYAMQSKGFQQLGQANKTLAAQSNAAIDALAKKQAQLKSPQELADQFKESDAKFLDTLNKQNIDPNRLWNNTSTGNKVLAGIGVLLSGIGSGLGHTENLAIKVIDNAINHDLDAQKNDQSKTMNLWKMNREVLGSDMAANLVTRNQLITAAQFQATKAANSFKSAQAQGNLTLLQAQAEQEKANNRAKLAILSNFNQARSGAEGEDSFLNKMESIKQLDPKLAQDAIKNYIPGVGTTKVAPTDKDRETLATSNATVNGLTELQALATHGPTIPGSQADLVNKTKMTALELEMKNAYQLGVLSQSDLDMLEKLVANPGSIRTDAAIAQLEATKKSIATKVKSLHDKLGVSPFVKSNQNNEALMWARQNPSDPRSAAILQKLGIK